MARRFARERFLFPNDLRENRIDPQAKPTDPFAKPSQGTDIQAPRAPFPVSRPDQSPSGLDRLASSLGVLGRSVDQWGQKNYQAFTERAEAAGAQYYQDEQLDIKSRLQQQNSTDVDTKDESGSLPEVESLRRESVKPEFASIEDKVTPSKPSSNLPTVTPPSPKPDLSQPVEGETPAEGVDRNQAAWSAAAHEARQQGRPDVARELQRMNPHMRRGYDNAHARNSALEVNVYMQEAYEANPVIDEETGLRLHDVELDDPAYQQWLAETQRAFIEEKGLDSIDPRSLALFEPARQDVVSRLNAAHAQLRGETRMQNYEDESLSTVQHTIADVLLDEEYIAGDTAAGTEDLAGVATKVLDDAYGHGYGGQELQQLQNQVVSSIISNAVASGDMALLDSIGQIEVGPLRPDGTRLRLIDTDPTIQSAVLQAQQRISAKEREDFRWENEQEDRALTEAERQLAERLANNTALFNAMGGYNSAEAIDFYERATAQDRQFAVESNTLAYFDRVAPSVRQNAVDNSRNTIIDYDAITELSAQVASGAINPTDAKSQLTEMHSRGVFGTGEAGSDAYLTELRRIEAFEDVETNRKQQALDAAASEFASVYERYYGYEVEANGEMTSIRDGLNAIGLDDGALKTIAQGGAEVQRWINDAQAAGVLDAGAAGQLRRIADGSINIFDSNGQPFDPAVVINARNSFTADGWRALEAEEERLGRPLTTQELDSFMSTYQATAINSSKGTLSDSNPLSTNRTPTGQAATAAEAVSQRLAGIEDLDGDVFNDKLLEVGQVAEAILYYNTQGIHHPLVVQASRNLGVNPDQLLSNQARVNGVGLDRATAIQLGQGSAASPGYNPITQSATPTIGKADITVDFGTERYTDSRGSQYWVDNSPAGSWDVTIFAGGSSAVNIPSPGNAVVVSTTTGCVVGDSSCGGGYGNSVVLKDLSTGLHWRVAHLGSVYVQKGDRIRKGQAFGKQGSTGNSSGDHLHIELLNRNQERISNRAYTEPIVNEWLDYMGRGEMQRSTSTIANRSNQTAGYGGPASSLPSIGSLSPSGGRGTGGGNQIGNGTPGARAIISAANQLQLDPREFAALMSFESAGTFDPSIMGGDGGRYMGLIQFSPDNQRTYGITPGMSLEAQLVKVVQYLKDRGFKPGQHRIENAYAAVLRGQAHMVDNVTDSNGTSVNSALSEFKPGGSHYQNAVNRYF